jgi:GH24 family phage-related lysozyme (muramidase)
MNDAGIALVKQFEGCKLKAYLCPAGVLTCGWGTTDGVTEDTEWTQDEADERLVEDLAVFEMRVKKLLQREATGNQLAALVSFAYNVGTMNLRTSTLLRKFNAGDIAGAAEQFPAWNKAGGRVLPGLIARRAAERALFLKED